jgi:D-alanine transaminase
MIIYFNGKYIKEIDCKISPYDRGFLFSDGVYEVIKYTGKEFFEFESHIERLKYGIKELKINFKEADKFFQISTNLLRKNHLEKKSALFYIQITRGISNPRNHLFPDKKVKPTVFASITDFISEKQKDNKGFKVLIAEDIRWGRCDIKSTLLLPNVLARQLAYEKKYDEAVLVRDGKITEGTHMSFGAIKNGCLYIPPLSNHILPGITRKVVERICKKIDIPVIKRNILINELTDFDEYILMSTKSDVVPVTMIDCNKFSIHKRKRRPGKIIKKIQNELKKLIIDNG